MKIDEAAKICSETLFFLFTFGCSLTLQLVKEPCSPRRGLLLFSSTPRNGTVDMPRENCQTVLVTL